MKNFAIISLILFISLPCLADQDKGLDLTSTEYPNSFNQIFLLGEVLASASDSDWQAYALLSGIGEGFIDISIHRSDCSGYGRSFSVETFTVELGQIRKRSLAGVRLRGKTFHPPFDLELEVIEISTNNAHLRLEKF